MQSLMAQSTKRDPEVPPRYWQKRILMYYRISCCSLAQSQSAPNVSYCGGDTVWCILSSPFCFVETLHTRVIKHIELCQVHGLKTSCHSAGAFPRSGMLKIIMDVDASVSSMQHVSHEELI